MLNTKDDKKDQSIKLHNLPGTGQKTRRRVGRGTGSGAGKTSGRGTKGQKARSGGGVRPQFEGGHTPLYRLLPKKRGFNSRFDKAATVNVDELDKHFKNGDVITIKKLVSANLVHANVPTYKVLGEGEIKKKLTIYADQASKQAIEKIEKAGGSIKLTKHEKKVTTKKSGNTNDKKGVTEDVQKVS